MRNGRNFRPCFASNKIGVRACYTALRCGRSLHIFLPKDFDKWPVVKWEVKGVVQSRLVGQSNYNVNFAVVFEVSNPATKKRVAGTATETEMLAPDASGNKKIISQHEKVTISHRSDGKP